MWKFQGLIKKELKFQGEIKKKLWNFQGSCFLAFEFQGVTQFCGISKVELFRAFYFRCNCDNDQQINYSWQYITL